MNKVDQSKCEKTFYSQDNESRNASSKDQAREMEQVFGWTQRNWIRKSSKVLDTDTGDNRN